MALRVPKGPSSQIFKKGYKNIQGKDEAIVRNIGAVLDLCKILRTSFGPNGRKKLVQNHLEKLFVTSDAATIVSELDVIHPAAKLLVMATKAQDAEMGDGTNLVNIVAGELLRGAEDLLRLGLHAAEIVVGYEHALEEARKILEELVIDTIEDLHDSAQLQRAIVPVLLAKKFDNCEYIAKTVAQAIQYIMPKNPRDFSVDSVRVVKILGGSLSSSKVVKGMVFGREAEGRVKRVEKARVAIFTCALDMTSTETKGTVLLHNAEELLGFSQGEEARVEKLLTAIRDAGVNVIVTGSSVGTLAQHFCDRLGIMVVKVLSKFDLRRLCRVTQATALLKVEVPTREELGSCDFVETIEIGSDRCTVFRQADDTSRTSTIVLRGATQSMLDDIERAIDDAINTVKTVSTKGGRAVAGAGACEIELARRLHAVAATTPGLNQYAIKKLAEALEAVPRILAENSGLDATETLAQLYVAHDKGNRNVGVVYDPDNDEAGVISDAKAAGIIDLLATKQWAFKLAMDTVLTVLRVDQIIMSKPSGHPKARENKNWDED